MYLGNLVVLNPGMGVVMPETQNTQQCMTVYF